jgi:thiaminase
VIDPAILAEEGLSVLQSNVAERWQSLLSSDWVKELLASPAVADRRTFAIYMTQVAHYTAHTARNQALVGVNQRNTDIHYMRYCFKHALEETGHEQMAIHDLKSIGAPIKTLEDLPPMLPATELMVAYLYWVASTGNPVQRLGFSFWAEQSYQFIGGAVAGNRQAMGLRKDQMTFFYSHAHIDEDHAEEVEQVLKRTCKTPEDWHAVTRVAEVTMDLSFRMLGEVAEVFGKLERGEETPYAIYQGLAPELVSA